MSYLANKLLAAARRVDFDQANLLHFIPLTKTGFDASIADLKWSLAERFNANLETQGVTTASNLGWIADHPRYAAEGALSKHQPTRNTSNLSYIDIPTKGLFADAENLVVPTPTANGNGVTFAIWMKPTEHIADYDVLFSQNGLTDYFPHAVFSPKARGWGVTIGDMGKISVCWGNGAANEVEIHTYDTAADFTVGEWHRIVVTITNPGSSWQTEVWIDKKAQVRLSASGDQSTGALVNPGQKAEACVYMAGTWADFFIWTQEMTQQQVNDEYDYDFRTPFINYVNDLYHFSIVPMKTMTSNDSVAYVATAAGDEYCYYIDRNIRMYDTVDIVLNLAEPTVASLPYMPITTGMEAYFYENSNWLANLDVGGKWMFIRADSSNAGSETYLYEYEKAGRGQLKIRLKADGKIKMSLNDTIGYTDSQGLNREGYYEMTSVSAVLPYDEDVLVAWYCDKTNWYFYIEGQGSIAMVETANVPVSDGGIEEGYWYERLGTGASGTHVAYMMEAAFYGPNKTTGRIYGTGASDRQWNTTWLDSLAESIKTGYVKYKPFNHNILS